MPDLITAMSRVFGSGDMTVFQAVVDAIGTGVVTIHLNGGTFTDVPYTTSAFFPAAGPSIGDPCYVLGRKGWGFLVFGKPAPGATRGSGDPQTYLWEPTTMGEWKFSSHADFGNGLTVTGTQHSSPQDQPSMPTAIWFYTSGNPVPGGAVLGSAAINLGGTWTQPLGGPAMDWDYTEIGLHNNAPSDTGPLNKIAGLNQSNRFASTFPLSFVGIPLDWANRLIAGTAKGIYVEALDFPMTFTGSGELRLTTL